MTCDMCGSVGTLYKTIIESAELNVCHDCSKFGKVIGIVKEEISEKIKKDAIDKEQEKEVLEVIAEDVGDKLPAGVNYTDFYVVSRTQNGIHHSECPHQTLVALIPRGDRVGLLYDMLGYLKESHINLSNIRSRTAPHILNGNCKGVPLMFYVEADCHYKDLSFIDAMAQIAEMLRDTERPDLETIRVIGSYKKLPMPSN